MNLVLGVTVFQYIFSTWIMIVSFEGIFIKFSNAGIEGNILILLLFLIATFANGFSVFIFGEPKFLKLNRREDK